MIACRTAALLLLLLLHILGERRERATRQANNAILVHRNNLSRIYKSYASFAGFLACVQTSTVFVPSATEKEVGTHKTILDFILIMLGSVSMILPYLYYARAIVPFFFFYQEKHSSLKKDF